ncbi:Fc.00g008410.m01.CDS01 [Cosmosporella sp. VM-42]
MRTIWRGNDLSSQEGQKESSHLSLCWTLKTRVFREKVEDRVRRHSSSSPEYIHHRRVSGRRLRWRHDRQSGSTGQLKKNKIRKSQVCWRSVSISIDWSSPRHDSENGTDRRSYRKPTGITVAPKLKEAKK